MKRTTLIFGLVLWYLTDSSVMAQTFTPFDRFTPFTPFGPFHPPSPRYYVVPYSARVQSALKLDEILRLKFAKGEDYFLETVTTTVQNMKVMDNDVHQKLDQTFVIQISPESQAVNGDWMVGVRVAGIRLKIDLGGNVIAYDSSNKGAASPTRSYFDALLMAKFKAVLRPDGVIRKMDGHEEFVKLLTFGSSHESQLKSMMSGDGPMKTMIAPLSEFLPAQPDRVGAHWLRHDDVDYGSIGRYLRKSKYVYHGNAGTVHEIRATTTMNYKAADKKDPGLPFEIADFKIAKAEGKGTFHFDADLGRLKESVQELHLIATLQIRVGNRDTSVDIDQTQTQKVRTLKKIHFRSDRSIRRAA